MARRWAGGGLGGRPHQRGHRGTGRGPVRQCPKTGDDTADAAWAAELDDLLLTIGRRFRRADLRARMRAHVRGLLGTVGLENGWQLAEYAGHRTPDGLQRLLNGARWNAEDLRDDLHSYVAQHLGEDDAVLIIDDTGFIKKGTTSAGVQRRYSGTAGRTESCQIGVFAAYATRTGRALVDRELYLPKSWTSDRERCRAAKIPDEYDFATKGDLAKRLVLRALASPLPLAWVTADAAHGQRDASAACWSNPVSATSWPCRSRSRSSARGPTTCSPRLPTGHGSRCPAETAPRDRLFTTGWRFISPRCGSSTTKGANTFAGGGRWAGAAAASPTRSPTTRPTLRGKP